MKSRLIGHFRRTRLFDKIKKELSTNEIIIIDSDAEKMLFLIARSTELNIEKKGKENWLLEKLERKEWKMNFHYHNIWLQPIFL